MKNIVCLVLLIAVFFNTIHIFCNNKYLHVHVYWDSLLLFFIPHTHHTHTHTYIKRITRDKQTAPNTYLMGRHGTTYLNTQVNISEM